MMALPLVAGLLLWLTGARLGRVLPPSTAVPLLTVAALVTALTTGFTLAVAAFLVVARIPAVAELGRWSAGAVNVGGSVPAGAGALAGLTVSLLLLSALRRVVRSVHALTTAELVCRRLSADTERLVIVEDDRPDAYALPGLHGRIVVSTAMLRALPAAERRVLLAHEAAHLTQRHYLYVQLADIAAAANPLLNPVANAVRAGVERWADEIAAAEVGDRSLAARALARAGLVRSHAAATGLIPAGALAAVQTGVADRTRALLVGPPRARRGVVAVLATLLLATTAATARTADDTHAGVERAQAAYLTSR